MFVNRVRELADLHTWAERTDARPGLVWGRRRVGKTALLQEFARGRRSVFHTGAGRAAQGELLQLSRQVAAEGLSTLRDLTARPFHDWDDALEHLAGAARNEPLLVVLDEYPELERSSPELPGVIRAFLDRAGSSTKLRLLLCGSAVRSMQALQEERAPLYGRFDLNLQVHPFEPWEAALMLPGMEPADRAAVYGLVGGMPLYLSWWDAAKSLRENVEHLVCRPGALLLNEGDLVMATEAEPGEQPAAVLHAIANGRTRHNEIKDWVGTEPTRTLDRLIALRLVERVVPVTEDPRRSKRRIYRLADNFLAFHLGLVSRYRAEIDRGLGDSILPVLLQGLDDHLGGPWEEVVRSYVRRECAAGRLAEDVVAVGRWWSPDNSSEVDVLTLSGRSRTPSLAGEVKWAKSVDAGRLARELDHSLSALGLHPEDAVRRLIAARERVDHLPEGVVGVTAADVFSAPA
ncbi:ATP-binding protein [Spongisporangium articulatum]|uniref:ATP-binding protein n=1 Tax=Spongisporangium articulatum TaxID=3362603 RepID=A0ABW8AHS5_9ACTN